jgi:hypothetical protein
VVRFTPWPLYSQYPLDRRLSGPQNWSGHSGEEKKYVTKVKQYKFPYLFPKK